MRKFIGTLVILALAVVGVGIYRGWFDISASDQAGTTNIEIKIDKEKIKQDAEAAKEKAMDITSQTNDESNSPTEPEGEL